MTEYTHDVVQPGACSPAFRQAFDAFLSGLPQYHYHQELDWFLCHAEAGHELLVTRRNADIVSSSVLRRVGYPLLRRDKCIIRNGPLYRDPASLAAHLQALCERLSGSSIDIRISPPLNESGRARIERQLDRAGFHPYVCTDGNYTRTVSVDLAPGLAGVSSGFTPSLRRQIRKAERDAGEVSTIGDEDVLRQMLQEVAGFYRQRHVGMPDPERLLCFLRQRLLVRNAGVALVLQREHRMVAGIVVVGCAARALFSFGFRASDPDLTGVPLSHLLHYRAIGWALENGYRCYDMGGYGEVATDNDSNRFKLGFSRTVETVSGDYLHSFHPLMTRLSASLGSIRRRWAG